MVTEALRPAEEKEVNRTPDIGHTIFIDCLTAL